MRYELTDHELIVIKPMQVSVRVMMQAFSIVDIFVCREPYTRS